MGYLVLQGGAEFSGSMRISDLRAMDLAGGVNSPIDIIPAAAAPDDNHERAGQNGCDWFHSLGARHVSVAMVIDRPSANDAQMSRRLRRSKLVYLLGGFPAHLCRVLKGSPCWQGVEAAYLAGAVISGSSAGAMVLCEYLYDPEHGTVIEGLGLVPGCCVLPHHNDFGKRWAPQLQKDLPHATLVGIDEHTAIINDGPGGQWRVYGPGEVVIYRNNKMFRHADGEVFPMRTA